MSMKTFGAIILGWLVFGSVYAQTIQNDFQARTEINLSYEPLQGLKLALIPELRLNESFHAEKYLLETKLSYEVLKGLELGGSHRYIINPREEKGTEYLHRFSLHAQYSHKIQRWKPSLRIKYTNYTDESSTSVFLRYRAKLNYHIRNSSLVPMASMEAYQALENNQLYKFRYKLGARYKITRKSAFDLNYSLDYFLLEYRNKHILGVGYRYTF